MPASIEGEAIGIEGMRERALLARRVIGHRARCGAGTTVRLSIPVEPS